VIDLSIVIVSWNTRGLLLDCLASIEREVGGPPQPLGLCSETLVVDNGSEDGSAEAVRAAFPSVEVVALGANRGFSAGSNAGLRRARGRFGLLLNSDTQLCPGVLTHCLRFLDAHPEVGILGPELQSPEGLRQHAIHALPCWLTELVPKGLLETLWPRRFPSKRQHYQQAVDVPAILGAALFVRRETLEEIGMLPEDHFLFLEETDLCLRAARAGWRVVHLPGAHVTHVHGASSKQRLPAETRIEYQRSLLLFFRKHRGPGQAFALALWRGAKALLYVILHTPLALRAPGRARLGQDWTVLSWYLRGCPADWGIPGRMPRPEGDPAPALATARNRRI